MNIKNIKIFCKIIISIFKICYSCHHLIYHRIHINLLQYAHMHQQDHQDLLVCHQLNQQLQLAHLLTIAQMILAQYIVLTLCSHDKSTFHQGMSCNNTNAITLLNTHIVFSNNHKTE